MRLIHLSFVSLLAHVAHAALFTDPAQLTKTSYDFVVVGAGLAGSVVASRLSENANFSVLVIEAGGNDAGVEPLQIPFTAPNLLNNASLIWNFTTIPQPFANNRVIQFQRGRVLGGSSSINFMVYTRGSRDDFDRIANVTGDPGWSWDAMLPFMLKSEKFVPPVDNHNTTGEFDPTFHSKNGTLLTTLFGFPTELDSRVLATTQADPVNFPFNLDANSGNTIGISWVQSTTGHGQRSSAATAFLHPALQRPNIDVLIGTQVTRLRNIADDGHDSTPDLREVEFAQSPTSPRRTIRASKEVILSAGPINSPHLLLLSGVGDSKQLSSHGIQTLVDSPGVGQNLQDHPLLSNEWNINSNSTLDPVFRNQTLANEILAQWEQNRTGLFSDAAANQFAWLRLPSNSSVFNGTDPSAGPTSAHIEFLFADAFLSFTSPSPPTGSFMSLTMGIISPTSRGSLTLASADPFTFPIIDGGFFSNPIDTAVAVQGLRTAMQLLATTPWQGFVGQPAGALANATTDEELADYARNAVTTFWHHSCTAKMGTLQDKMAVLDPSLRVKGVNGLRVVDISVFPFVPAAHTQAPTYAIAERAANLIQTAWTSGSHHH